MIHTAKGITALSLITLSGLSSADLKTDSGSPLLALSLEELVSMQVVVAASGYEQPVNEAPAVITVINRDEWRAAGATALVDILHMVPGVHATKTRTGLASTSANIRGITGSWGNQVLILIDGRPFRYLQNNGRFIGQRIPLDSYGRVEVIRGPGSAIYGADAVGGVINLVTDKYDHNALSVVAGSFDSYQASWRQHGSHGELNWQGALQYQTSNDDPNKIVTSDLQSSLDDIFGTTASKAPGRFDQSYELVDVNVRLDWKKLWLSSHLHKMINSGLGSGVAQALDPKGRSAYRSEHWRAGYSLLDEAKQKLNVALAYNYMVVNTYLHVFPEGTALPIGADGNVNFVNPEGIVSFPDGFIGTPSNNASSTSASLTHLLDTGNHRIRSELGYEKQYISARENKNFGPNVIDGSESEVDGSLTNVTNTPWVYFPDSKRELVFLSLQDEWNINDKWAAIAGVRFDHYSDFGSTTNPRISLSWALTPRITLKSFAGSAFRPPSFIELYAQNNPAAIGNPELGAEKGKTYQAGFSSTFSVSKNLIIEGNIYQYEIKDLIEFVSNPITGILISENVGEQKGWGAEIEGRWRANQYLDLKGHYANMQSEDIHGHASVGNPNQLAYLQAIWQLAPQWSLFASARWVGERERAISDTRDSLDGYSWLSSRLAYNTKQYEVSLFVDNLLDADAREPSDGSIADDFPSQGRSIALQLQLKY